ncbi:MAG: HupE/UreJ family protein [Proteobacteria bacterium]|nr:HupE/UreJ family protein [Pseudomonadota bacterium]
MTSGATFTSDLHRRPKKRYDFRTTKLQTGVLVAVLWAIMTLGHQNGLAHIRSESFSKWQLRPNIQGGTAGDRIEVVLTMKLETALGMGWNASDAASLRREMSTHALQRILLSADNTPCSLIQDPKAFVSTDIGYVRLEWSMECPRQGGLAMEFDAFFTRDPSHTHIARMSIGSDPLVEKLFTTRHRRWIVREREQRKTDTKRSGPAGSSLVNYWIVGVEHIASGVDHLTFLLGLILLCRSLRDVVTLITGFTVGHTVVLGLGLMEIIDSEPSAVEFLIGYTVFWVAVENVARKTGTGKWMGWLVGAALGLLALLGLVAEVGPPWLTLLGMALFSFCYLQLITRVENEALLLRPAVTILFGFVHGSGFAGSLMKIGLPTDRYFTALLGFNLGVECGQLIMVAAFWLFARSFVRLVPQITTRAWQQPLGNITTAFLCGVGIFWFVSRAYA